MSKGELKKGIDELFKYYYNRVASGYESRGNAKMDASALKTNITRLCNRAKKEFPTHLMDLAFNPNYMKIQEWFEKWFEE